MKMRLRINSTSFFIFVLYYFIIVLKSKKITIIPYFIKIILFVWVKLPEVNV